MSTLFLGRQAYSPGRQLESIGRAQRFFCEGPSGEPCEVWRLAGGATSISQRLLALGKRGIGGFIGGGRDEEGLWLIRGAGTPLDVWLREQEHLVCEDDALSMIATLADALAGCEELALFPGALRPSLVHVHTPLRCELRADALVYGLLAATYEPPRASAKWMSPEELSGSALDFASCRYVLGLFLYRLLVGEYPFTSRSVRLALADRANRGAPPFPHDVGETLAIGLQAYCLRLLAPEIGERPETALQIAKRLRGHRENERGQPLAKPHVSGAAGGRPHEAMLRAATEPLSVRSRRPRVARQTLVLGTALVGLAFAGLAIAAIAPPSTRQSAVAPRTPMTSALSPDDCTSCHPRQRAEWERSVMAHSVKSPLFQSLEMLIQEQVGKSNSCPEGAGILRGAASNTACRNPASGHLITGSGGELWCANCHAPAENLRKNLPDWNGTAAVSSSRQPLRDLLPKESMEGIHCTFCHQVTGPVTPGNERVGRYEGNPNWTSFLTGSVFSSRPEDGRGLFGIANSGYLLDPRGFLAASSTDTGLVPGGAHVRSTDAAKEYLRSSEFCGSCHDVRLFGTDVIGGRAGEPFKRLRNAYSEWKAWSLQEAREGRRAATCQDCHMSTYPGICEPGEGETIGGACPDGTHFSARAPGLYPTASTSAARIGTSVTTHYFSGVDVPLSREFPIEALDDSSLDSAGIPLGARQRRDLLLASTFDLRIEESSVRGDTLDIPIVFENIGAGHRVPAGFSQEREVWLHLRVTDANGRLVYEVGNVGRGDEDLADKIVVRVNTSDASRDRLGQPVGLFGADIIDGPDVPKWQKTGVGDHSFRGQGLVNLQNGFLRCVRCIGRIDDEGQCQPGPGQGSHRAGRFADGDYDLDTGECRSNLRGENALFEVFFPVGALDATRGVVRGPDAIVDSRSAPPNVPIRYVYELSRNGAQGPFTVEARLLFRAFPPFLLRAFAAYEREQVRSGHRPSGPLLTTETLERLEAVEIATASASIP